MISETQIIKKLRLLAEPANVVGMARFGINPQGTLGVSIPKLRALAKEIGRDHALAQKLWVTKIHEARLLAGFIDDWRQVTEAQMEKWAKDFDSWDVCDQVVSDLFDKTKVAYDKAKVWAKRPEEFVKRAGYVLMAALAVHDKKADDAAFRRFFPLIKAGATDERNFVKKAVNWALRQIGKRNQELNRSALALAAEIQKIDSRAARWVAADAIRELKKKKFK